MSDFDWNGVLGIRIFHASSQPPSNADIADAEDFPVEQKVPGYLCQAARMLLGFSQQELHELANVSKKSINDYENGAVDIKASLVNRMAVALREAGVRFVAGPRFVGVVVRSTRSEAEDRIRRRRERQSRGSDRISEGEGTHDAPGTSERRPRGRPRNAVRSRA
ncbi:helix-turn-helix domain-containing protein [Methylobacterium sp. J-070]|uniref:helix-turn-helix domain-containing protein n=1 Tax=Methylobacterium sp. J-070 TaxID=2836650 RepID=UPI001FBBC0B1|nr:helix-turn-helix transcriptional regulator [Methylobacterium sp. J-070]